MTTEFRSIDTRYTCYPFEAVHPHRVLSGLYIESLTRNAIRVFAESSFLHALTPASCMPLLWPDGRFGILFPDFHASRRFPSALAAVFAPDDNNQGQ
jgi:hypothetical protein